jgi:single-strand DNA-binding protein
MAGDTQITLVGNLTGDPELRFTPSGAAVANFTVASNPRHFDKQTNGWVEDQPLFLRCNAWRDLAEHVTESLTSGMRVIVQGRLKQRQYEHEGQKRSSYEVEVDEVGPSLRWATAQVRKVSRENSGGGGYAAGQDDPWASATPAGGGGGGWASTGQSDEPPF